MTAAAIAELRAVFQDPEVQGVIEVAKTHPERPTAARLLFIARLAEVVLAVEGEGR